MHERDHGTGAAPDETDDLICAAPTHDVYMGRGNDPVVDLIEADEPGDLPRQYYGREAILRLRGVLQVERDPYERRRLRRLIAWCARRPAEQAAAGGCSLSSTPARRPPLYSPKPRIEPLHFARWRLRRQRRRRPTR